MRPALILILLAAALSAACTNPTAPSRTPGSGASAPLNSNDGGPGGSDLLRPQKVMGGAKIGEG